MLPPIFSKDVFMSAWPHCVFVALRGVLQLWRAGSALAAEHGLSVQASVAVAPARSSCGSLALGSRVLAQ